MVSWDKKRKKKRWKERKEGRKEVGKRGKGRISFLVFIFSDEYKVDTLINQAILLYSVCRCLISN